MDEWRTQDKNHTLIKKPCTQRTVRFMRAYMLMQMQRENVLAVRVRNKGGLGCILISCLQHIFTRTLRQIRLTSPFYFLPLVNVYSVL